MAAKRRRERTGRAGRGAREPGLHVPDEKQAGREPRQRDYQFLEGLLDGAERANGIREKEPAGAKR